MILDLAPGFIFLIVLGIVAVIAIVAFLLYLYLRPRLKTNDKPSDDEIVKEEMNRILKPVDDEDTAKAIEEYKEEDE